MPIGLRSLAYQGACVTRKNFSSDNKDATDLDLNLPDILLVHSEKFSRCFHSLSKWKLWGVCMVRGKVFWLLPTDFLSLLTNYYFALGDNALC